MVKVSIYSTKTFCRSNAVMKVLRDYSLYLVVNQRQKLLEELKQYVIPSSICSYKATMSYLYYKLFQ